MKRILLIMIVVLISTTSAFAQKDKSTLTILDFRPWTENGFFISTLTVDDYTPVAMLDIVAPQTQKNQNAVLPGSVEMSDVEVLIDRLVQAAENLGANAIINLKITNDATPTIPSKEFVFRSGLWFNVSGLAVILPQKKEEL